MPQPRDEPIQTLRERLPAPALRNRVVCLWEQRVAEGATAHTFRTVPDGATEIVCELGGPPRVCGPRTGPVDSSVTPGTVIVGLRLRPGAAASALGLDASELVDRELEAGAVLGDRAARRLAECESPEQLAGELQRALAARADDAGATADDRAPGGDPFAVLAARLLARGLPVATVAEQLSISERQLHRRLVRAAGIAPKPLARTLRYQRFLAFAARTEHPAGQLARLAADAGYADQSHLTREARRLAGATPADVLHEAALDCTGIHDHAASHDALLTA